VVLWLARTGAGALGATSFSAPLLAVAEGGLVSPTEAGGGFVSLTRRAGWGAGCGGLDGASVGFVAEASSCAPLVSALRGGVGRAVVPVCRTPQPTRQSESAAMRIVLETAARGKPERRHIAGSGHSDRVSRQHAGPRGPRVHNIRLRAFKGSLALMSIIVASVSFRPGRPALRRSARSPQDHQQHGSRQTQLGRPSPFSY